MTKTKAKRRIPSVQEATAHVARAEQRAERALDALAAAQEEERVAKHELNTARRGLRDANRAAIERQK